jgi:hypothetical protein
VSTIWDCRAGATIADKGSVREGNLQSSDELKDCVYVGVRLNGITPRMS